MTGNLPAWPGADACYSRAYRILAEMGRSGHVQRTGSGRRARCHVSAEMTDFIGALNRGDEERIKAGLWTYRDLEKRP